MLFSGYFIRELSNRLILHKYAFDNNPKIYKTGREFADAVLDTTGIMFTPGDVFGPSCAQNFRLALVPTCEDIETCFDFWQQQIEKGNFKL